jgi:hypothetical protein
MSLGTSCADPPETAGGDDGLRDDAQCRLGAIRRADMNPHDELAAQYALARSANPEADIEEIVALVAERISIDAETALASESLSTTGDVDVVRQFVYEIEWESEPDGD